MVLNPGQPRRTAQAAADALIAAPAAVPPSPGRRHWDLFNALSGQIEATGNDFADAFLAAFAVENNATWLSADRGFARFDGLRWEHPLSYAPYAPRCRSHTGAMRVEVRVIPRARKDEVGDERAGRLLVRTTAPPTDGKANEALRRLLAKHFGVPVRKVEIVAGHHSRDKTVEIAL